MTENPEAFPSPETETTYARFGMTLRDWFAGQALAALVSRHRADVAWSEIAPRAFQIADDMLAERALTKP